MPFIKWTEGTWSGWACQTPACRAKQAKYALWLGQSGHAPQLAFLPLPRQVDAFKAVLSRKYRWILFGGARGGGKSLFMRWLAYSLCLRWPNFQVVLLRRTYTELEKSHMRRMGAEAKLLRADFVPSAHPPVLKFANGSVLEMGHCQDAQDIENYLSAEYHLVLPDELGTFDEDMILKIGASARIAHPEFRPCIVASTNPGARWVKDRWIDQHVDPERFPNYEASDYFFVQSKLDDNPYPDPEYERYLNSLDPDTRAAWRDGSWDVFEGQYFKEFRSDQHIQHIEIPPEVPRIGGMDWGFAARGVHLWAAVLPDGHLHITNEYVFRETLASEVGRQIVQMTTEPGYTLSGTWADPAMWSRHGQSGESIAETLQRAGVALQRANHSRVNGWQRLRHWLRPSPNGTPWLTIEPDCAYLIRTLPALTHDEKNPEDIDTTGEDHAADALRYLVMGRPSPTVSTPRAEPPADSAGRLFQDAVRGAQPQILGAEAVRGR